MELLLYFAKVTLTSGVMFLYYRIFLKDATFHHYNRFYLLATVLISLLLPLLKFRYFTLEVNSSMYLMITRLQNYRYTHNSPDDHIYIRIGIVLTFMASLFLLSRFSAGLIKIRQLKKRFPYRDLNGIRFYMTDLPEAPFSFFRNLFWKTGIAPDSPPGKQILNHEMVHIEQKHSWDRIILETAASLFWFNPFFHLIKKEIYLIHEYAADKKAIKNMDTKAFAQWHGIACPAPSWWPECASKPGFARTSPWVRSRQSPASQRLSPAWPCPGCR